MIREANPKTPTELALDLYPVIQELWADDMEHNQQSILEALYLLMQMMYGPVLAGRVISAALIHQ